MKALLLIAACISLQSCIYYPLMHYSVDQNVPMITEKGEAQLSASTGTETFGIQGAYGITNSISVMGSYSTGVNDMIGDGDNAGITELDNGNRYSGELAVGYFYPFTDNFSFEIYGGVERYFRNYSVYSYYGQEGPTSDLHTYMSKPFVQLDLGLHTVNKNGFALSLKVGDMIFDHFYDKVTTLNNNYQNQTNILTSYSNASIAEPCLTFHFGGKIISGQIQLGMAWPYFDYSPNYLVNLENPYMFIEFGLQAKLFRVQKK